MDFNWNVLEKDYIMKEINFPYIPTYLAYRELPLLRKLIERMNSKPSVILVDGNGIMHPYGLGIASHLGVLIDIPTIGVAKGLLYGEVKGSYVFDGNKKIGYVFKKNKRPIFVSPGHRISLETSIKVVKNFLKYRIPEPIRQAHILAKSKIVEIDQRT